MQLIVIAAIKSTDELDFPQLQLDDNNLQCLVSDPDIYFHSSLNKYIRKSNKRDNTRTAQERRDLQEDAPSDQSRD